MQNFSRSQGSAARLAYAVEVAAGIRRDPVCKHLAGDLDAANLRLKGAWLARLESDLICREARAELRTQHRFLRKALGGVLKVVRIVTRADDSALERELFPDGAEGAKAHNGPDQLALAVKVLARLASSKNEGAEGVRSVWMTLFQSEVDSYGETVAALVKADAERQRLRDTEEEVREDHARTLAVTDAGLRALFPRSHKWRRIFDPPGKPRKRTRSGDEVIEPEEQTLEDDDDPEDDLFFEPPAPPASAPPAKPDAA